MFKDIFKQLIQNANITAYQLSKETGLSESLISNWKSGRQLPKYDSLVILADYFNVSGDLLLGRERSTVNNVPISLKNETIKPNKKSKMIQLYLTRASAGTGNWLSDDVPYEYMTIPINSQTEKADFLVKVSGDSMQPKYFDGDILLVKSSPSIIENEIGVFVVNNEAYVKKMGRGELISLNPSYQNVKLNDYDDVRCAGKVLGTIEL